MNDIDLSRVRRTFCVRAGTQPRRGLGRDRRGRARWASDGRRRRVDREFGDVGRVGTGHDIGDDLGGPGGTGCALEDEDGVAVVVDDGADGLAGSHADGPLVRPALPMSQDQPPMQRVSSCVELSSTVCSA